MKPISVSTDDAVTSSHTSTEVAAGLGTKSGRMARLWGKLLTSEKAFDPLVMRSLRVERALTESAIQDAIALRQEKYREAASAQLEKEDTASNSELFVCYAPSGGPVGSIRASFLLQRGDCLKVEKITKIPDCWRLRADGVPSRLAEGMRLCVAGRTKQEQLCVKLALWRAVYLRCLELNVDWLLTVARPPLNSDYQLVSYERHQPEPHWAYPPDNPIAHELMALNVRSEAIACRKPGHWINRAFFPDGQPQ
jgi:hypothetical protein